MKSLIVPILLMLILISCENTYDATDVKKDLQHTKE